MVKRMHAGRAAAGMRIGLARLHRPPQAIDGRFGLLEVIGSADEKHGYLDEDLGLSFASSRVWVKVYPCCGFIHLTAHALEALKRECGLTPEQGKQVRMHTNRHGVERIVIGEKSGGFQVTLSRM